MFQMSPMTDVVLTANVTAKGDSPGAILAPAKLVVDSKVDDDKRRILEMHRDSFYTACMYVSIILGCYFVAMLILFAYHVKQKHGRISLYDIYLELAPRRCAESGATTTSSSESTSSLSTAAAATSATTNGSAKSVVPEPATAQSRIKFYRKKRRARKSSKTSATTSCSAAGEGDAAPKTATEAISASVDVHASEEARGKHRNPVSLPTLMETAL